MSLIKFPNIRKTVRKQTVNLISYILMIALAYLFIYPTFNIVRISLGGSGRISLQSYVNVLQDIPFTRYFANSAIVASSTIILGLFVNSALAYVLARTQWRLRFLVLGLVIALLIIPFEVLAVPLVLLTNRLGWLDSLYVQIIPFIADPLSIFLLYQFFVSIPRDLEEAALVDGMGRVRIFLRIVVPISRPVFATAAILRFLFLWDSYLWPLMVTRGPRYRPLTVGLRHSFGVSDLTAYATMMTLPTLILFLFLQKLFVESVAEV